MKRLIVILLFCSTFFAQCKKGVEQNEVVEPPSSGQSLRSLAAKAKVEIGVAFDGWQFNDSEWKETVSREFNLATIHWGMYWYAIQPELGVFKFDNADKQVQFAVENGMTIRGHALVFPETYPDWLSEGNFTDDELLDILRLHIQTIMKRYKGVIKQWVVVNEPYLDHYREKDIFYQHFGYDYIEYAFEFAREADSNAILIYNDTGNHIFDSETYDLTRSIVERLLDQGLVDGVGLQMHLYSNNVPSKNDITSLVKGFNVDVYITEFDVDMRYFSGKTVDKLELQAKIYRDMFEACLMSGNCSSFTVWQIRDKYSWREYPENLAYTASNADPTMYDDNLRPKPAYFALRGLLENFVAGKLK